MKQIIGLLFSSALFSVSAQSADIAGAWFDKYEYEKAIESYEAISDYSILTSEDHQRWCYSHFITGNYSKSLSLSDSLLNTKNVSAYTYYVNGYSAFSVGKYSQAEQSFLEYKNLDTEYFVDSLIASCRKIPEWENEDYVALTQQQGNSNKADFSGGKLNNGIIFFHESGIDEKENIVQSDALENAELMFARPQIHVDETKEMIPIVFPEEFKLSNITSFAIDSKSEDIFVTINNPVSTVESEYYPRIYKGKMNDGYTVYQLDLWEHSGINDSTSTAHATINESGNLLVFSKQGENTENADLYFSKKIDGIWSKPEQLEELNTGGDEMFPLFMGDSLLSFASNGRVGYGCLDIYLAKISSEQKVEEVVHLKQPVNSPDDDFNFIFTSEKAEIAFFSSNRKGGTGDDDIYQIQFRKETEPEDTSFNNYIDNWNDIIVYFEFDKFHLTQENKEKIEELKEFLEKYSQVKLLIEGHADRRGTEEYNMDLGQKRAETVGDFLAEKGFSRQDISTVSKGKTEPAFECSNGCTEAEHQLNRFAKIKLVAHQK